MRNTWVAAGFAVCLWGVVADAVSSETVEEVFITGVRERMLNNGMLKDVIQKTEVISEVAIERANAANLSEALAAAPGVRVNNECSMCGVKRLMVNGLRGEHTTILVDGIPTFTMMSGFYGIDAATTAGVQRIEIARGAGASMIAPEAVGGTVNLVTKVAEHNGVEFDLAGGEWGYRKAALTGTTVSSNDATRFTITGQHDARNAYDGDNNGIGENPELENLSAVVFLSQDFATSDNLRLRLSIAQSEIFGGPTGTDIDAVKAGYFADPDWESSRLFVDDDVRNRYIGRHWESTEWIKSDRTEFYATWLHEFHSALNLSLTGSYNRHEQDSFYEGFIYDAENPMVYLDAKIHWSVNDDHLLIIGIDSRQEELRSETNADSENYVSDSFDYETLGAYLQDSWSLNDHLELAAAVRFDRIKADFIDPQKPDTEIDESILSPRVDLRWMHNAAWTSRLSAGRGYRAPLSFFESDHGLLDGDAGFSIEIDRLERSLSYNYALSFEGARFNATGSLAQTTIEHLATLSESEAGVPLLAQADEDATALVADMALNYALSAYFNLSATLEKIHYNAAFKQAFGVVPAEERLILSMDWSRHGWDFFARTTWIGARDLSEYGTPANPTFDRAGTQPKSQDADAYWTLDIRLDKEFFNHLHLYAGADNLLDYNQATDMETPLFYEDGGYDVAHIYGPLRGRVAYIGLKYHL